MVLSAMQELLMSSHNRGRWSWPGAGRWRGSTAGGVGVMGRWAAAVQRGCKSRDGGSEGAEEVHVYCSACRGIPVHLLVSGGMDCRLPRGVIASVNHKEAAWAWATLLGAVHIGCDTIYRYVS